MHNQTIYKRVPVAYMVEGVKQYLEHGIRPGTFLCALFSNNLKDAFAYADPVNHAAMAEWVGWLYNDCPSLAQGNPLRMNEWIEHRGLEGFGYAAEDKPAKA